MEDRQVVWAEKTLNALSGSSVIVASKDMRRSILSPMEITHGHPRDGVAIVPAQFNKTVVNKTCHAVCCLSRNASYVAIPPGNDAVKTTSHESRLLTNHGISRITISKPSPPTPGSPNQ